MSREAIYPMSKTILGLTVVLILFFGIVASPLLASGQVATDKGTLKVSISTDPKIPKPTGQTKLKIDFLNPKTNAIQEHIDYTVSVTKGGKSVFGPIPLTHTSLGTVTIQVQFKENGEHQVIVDVQGILFLPIPSEKATITIKIGEDKAGDKKIDDKAKKTTDKKTDTTKKKVTPEKKPVKKPKPKTSGYY